MPKHTNPLIVLGFDFGMRRIGVAIGQTITTTARPLTVLDAKDGIPRWKEIGDLISTWQAEALIVGVPYNIDGSDQEISLAAKKFSRRLESKFKLPVHLIDERYSTKTAQSNPEFKTNKNAAIDSYAAAIILDAWLQQQPPSQ